MYRNPPYVNESSGKDFQIIACPFFVMSLLHGIGPNLQAQNVNICQIVSPIFFLFFSPWPPFSQ